MLGRNTRRLSVAAAMIIALGVSGALAFDPSDLEKLKATNSCVKCDLRGADLYADVYVDMTNAILTGADLTNANLALMVLRRVDLTGAILTGADLTKAYLKDADLTGADLTNVNLKDSILTDANLTNAKLGGAILCGTIMPDGQLDNSGCP